MDPGYLGQFGFTVSVPPVGVRDAGDGECRPAHSCDRCPPAQQLPSVHLGAGHANSFPNVPAVAFGAGYRKSLELTVMRYT